MSLFPAYSDGFQETGESSTKDKEWLTNNSFTVTFPSKPLPKDNDIEIISSSEDSVTVVEVVHGSTSAVKKKKKEKRKRKKKKKQSKSVSREGAKQQEIQYEENDCFMIDKERRTAYLTMKTLPKGLKFRYYYKTSGLVPISVLKKKKKSKRYFKSVDHSEGFNEGTLSEETTVSKKTEEFNKKLAENPHDISSWIEFVNFQDEFYKYQHIKYKSSFERERATCQHKLSILDKAVAKNPDNRELQALWLKIGTSVLPSEEMSSRIEQILEKSGGTMILWLGLMTTTQHSLARCTVPSVTSLYEKLLLNFQKVKQPDIYGRDLNVLELLFHYGRFLDNSGHWEILLTMIKVNLHFNTKINLNLEIKVDEKVKQLENVVLEKEKQAIWQLWSQLERIREGLHFLPDSDSVDYPQRCVSPESVVNFTWHFHPDLHFQVIVSFIVLLKVPLLPSTDTILKVLSPNSLPWAFDSPEYILSSVLTSPAVNLRYSYLSPVTQLSKGPQYLRRLHGQSEFLSLINDTFSACLKCLAGKSKTALGVWWLRFERWIYLLSKLRLAFLPDDKKNVKSFFKDFLKSPENRNNILYYIEYSLLELSLGNTETCIKTLKTLISSHPPVLGLDNVEDKGITTSAYRTLCEVYVRMNRTKDAVNLLINLGNGSSPDTEVSIHLLSSAEKKFEKVSAELINDLDSFTSSFENLLTPQFVVEWISCYFWFVGLLKPLPYFQDCYQKILNTLNDKNSILADHTRESLWESIITIVWSVNNSKLVFIKDILKQSFTSFPRNLKILTFVAEEVLQRNEYWWALKKKFLSNLTPFSCIFLICLALEKFEKDQENFKNRIKNLFQTLVLQDGRLLSMVHCLRLRFLFENENVLLENAQLQALESCPWNKSIYMESILLLPAKLMQLTDVLIEKELRIHITPDEIQEMRD